jgi:hypothetical protein
MLAKSQLEEAQLENLASDPSNLPEGRIWQNITSRIIKFVKNGVIEELIDRSATQTITNKTLGSNNKVGAGTAGHVIVNDGSGNLTSEATLAKARGGAGADMSGVTFPSTGVIPTLDGSLPYTGQFALDFVNDSSAGSSITLASPSKSILRLTGVGTITVAGITAPTTSRIIFLINGTGQDFTIVNDSPSATAANRIVTGAADITVRQNAALLLAYDLTYARWMVIGGTGGGGNIQSQQDLSMTSGYSIAVPNGFSAAFITVAGASSAITMSTTPFGTSAPPADLYEVTLCGLDDVNTVRITYNDINFGCVGNFSEIILAKYQTVTFRWSGNQTRWVLC